jgi:N-acetylmuramoyl-L-alanine amidase
MRKFLSLSIAVIASTTIGIVGAFRPATAIDFGQQEVDQNRFVAVAVPHIGNSPHLVIIEQISDSQACWKESGTNPVTVDPLLLKFDFTGICRRGTDANGYSIRMQVRISVCCTNSKSSRTIVNLYLLVFPIPIPMLLC